MWVNFLQPSLSETTDNIFKQLNTENRYYDSLDNFNGLGIGINLNDQESLFARIDKEPKFEEINS